MAGELRNDVLEQAAQIADWKAQRARDAIARCDNWSPAQAEWSRGRIMGGSCGSGSRGAMTKAPPKWALGPHDDVIEGVAVRLNKEGTIDEIVTDRPMRFHLRADG